MFAGASLDENSGAFCELKANFFRLILTKAEFLFFIIGTMLGGLFGVVCMCCLQINRLSERKEVDNAKKKCADTFPSD